MITIATLADLRARAGQEMATSDWLVVDQQRINAFADATGDHQWIHVDAERAVRETPFGTTIAHGFLTLSLCVPMLSEVLPRSGSMSVNYGTNRVRFLAPVPSGSRVRGRFRVLGVDDVPLGRRARIEATVECDRVEKPVCAAELLVLTVS